MKRLILLLPLLLLAPSYALAQVSSDLSRLWSVSALEDDNAPGAVTQETLQTTPYQYEPAVSCPGWIWSPYDGCNPGADGEFCDGWHVEAAACWRARDYSAGVHEVECSAKSMTRNYYCLGFSVPLTAPVRYTEYSDGQLPADALPQISGYRGAKWRECTSYIWKFGYDVFGDWHVAQKRKRFETSLYGEGCVGGS